MDYEHRVLSNQLNGKINAIFKTSHTKNFEIMDKRIFDLIFGKVGLNKNKLFRFRFFYISGLKSLISELKKTKIPNMKICKANNTKCDIDAGEVIDTLLERDVKLFLHGGTLRDFFMGKHKGTDIDLVFNEPLTFIQTICLENAWECPPEKAVPKFQYILFGGDKGVSLEGVNMNSTFFVPLVRHEFTVSDLAYDLKNNILIDITGRGLEDVIYRRIRITPPEKLWETWATEDWKKPLRYFKLELIGMKPVNARTRKFCVNFINDNFEDVYMGNLYSTIFVPRILHFLIANIAQGELNNETGKIKHFGPLMERLKNYLHLLSKYIKPEYMQNILNLIKERSDIEQT